MSLTATRLQEEQKEEKRRKVLSALLTSSVLAVMLVVLIFFGFTYLDPPPPEIAVELSMEGEQGFGNTEQINPKPTQQQNQSENTDKPSESFETQTHEDAPTAPTNPTPNENWKFTSSEDKPTDDKNTKPSQPSKGKNPLGGGIGLGSKGIGSFLFGRSPKNKITASCKFGRDEVIIVKIKVNGKGEVIYADCVMKYKFRGTTLNATTRSNPYCNCAKSAARSVIYDSKSDAPTQEGAIKFDYKVK